MGFPIKAILNQLNNPEDNFNAFKKEEKDSSNHLSLEFFLGWYYKDMLSFLPGTEPFKISSTSKN